MSSSSFSEFEPSSSVVITGVILCTEIQIQSGVDLWANEWQVLVSKEYQVYGSSSLVEEEEVVDVDEDEGGDDDQIVGTRSDEQASFDQEGHQVDHLCHNSDQVRGPLHDERAVVEPGEEARERRQPAHEPEEHEERRCQPPLEAVEPEEPLERHIRNPGRRIQRKQYDEQYEVETPVVWPVGHHRLLNFNSMSQFVIIY